MHLYICVLAMAIVVVLHQTTTLTSDALLPWLPIPFVYWYSYLVGSGNEHWTFPKLKPSQFFFLEMMYAQ